MAETLGYIITLMSSLAAHADLVVGLFLPPLVQWLNKEVPESKERFLVTLMACVFAAILLRWQELLTGQFDDLVIMFSIVFTESQAVYNLYFKGSYIQARLNQSFGSNTSTEGK